MLDVNKYVIEEKIRWSDRISNAFQYSIQALTAGITNILLSPIIFFRILFTPSRKTLDIVRMIEENPGVVSTDALGEFPQGPFPPMEGGESWKQEHDKLFGEDDE